MGSDRYALPPADGQQPATRIRTAAEVDAEMIPRGATKKRMAFWYGSRRAFNRARRRARLEQST